MPACVVLVVDGHFKFVVQFDIAKKRIKSASYAGLFFRFSTPNSDAILALTQADFRPNSADFLA